MTPNTSRIGSVIVLAILVSFLVLAIVFLVVGWGYGDTYGGPPMSAAGYVAMTFGIVATLVLGIGPMALVFYSNRKGHD
jgi:formate hydrogenlyase subunit 3/multisubunit Na+/H+ antiporter MnhD subunit